MNETLEFENPLKGKSTAVKVLVILGILLLVGAIAYAATQITISSNGNILTAAQLSASPNTISWGDLNPNQIVDRYVTLTNNGDNPTIPLTVSTNPLPTVGTLTHNATSVVIQPHSSVTVDFRLTVSVSPPTGAFAFDITVTG